MRYTKLPKMEQQMKVGDNGNYKLKPFSIKIKGEESKLEGYTFRPSNGYDGYYYDERPKKEKIVLHFTAGHLRGDLSSLTFKDRGHVSVPFVIARDGTLYQLFSSAAWSYHLGKAAIGGNKAQSQKSIGIELSNFGPLKMKAGKLMTIYNYAYCDKSDTEMYTKLDTPYRGERYFATYTEAQYDTLVLLLRYLTAEYKIPRHFLDKDIRYEATEEVIDFKGILTHANYRTSGKWDIGPAFDWDRVIKGVKSTAFTEAARTQKAINSAKMELRKAKQTLKEAQSKVDELEQKIEELESTPLQSRSLVVSSGFKSEKAIEKAFPKKRGKGKTYNNNGEGPPEDEDLLRQFYK